MAINEITMFADNYYETGNKGNNKSSSSNLIFSFSTNCDDKTEFTVKSVIGDIQCKTKQQYDDFSEYYTCVSAEFSRKDNALYDIYEQKKTGAYKQYENNQISKMKYNRMCKQYYNEYKDAKLAAWNEVQTKLKQKAEEMGLIVISPKTNVWTKPF